MDNGKNNDGRWFLTVDWCNTGKRGIFVSIDGTAFSKDIQHAEDEMAEILGPFWIIMNPESREFSENELQKYRMLRPLSEYSGQYGIALNEQAPK